MCGRFTVLTRSEVEAAVRAVENRQPLAPLASGASRIHARPTSTIPVFTEVFDVVEFTWGFAFPWSKAPVFNTRVESLLEDSPAWREAAREGRCVVPVASFFEPHATETVPSPRSGRPMKRPYEFCAPDASPLLLAGIAADGHCSIVTTQPNSCVSPVHDRMPLVLRADEVAQWFEGDWTALADRRSIVLSANPEELAQAHGRKKAEDADQLSLF